MEKVDYGHYIRKGGEGGRKILMERCHQEEKFGEEN
jgi:hypothetical protein